MSWAYAKHRFNYTWTLDPSEWNDNIVSFASEMNGNLGEQNWLSVNGGVPFMKQAINDGKAEDDAVARSTGVLYASDPHGFTAYMSEVKQNTRWTPVEGYTIGPFTSRGGLALIVFSFQMHCDVIPAACSGMNFGIEVDGRVFMGSLLGTGDQSNDFLDAAFGATVAGSEVTFDFGSSPSFRAYQEPKMVRLLTYLVPGQHTIRLVARNLFTVTAAVNQYITNGEGFVIDHWA